MQENLEEFIKNNRQKFDDKKLDKNVVWDNIEANIPKKRHQLTWLKIVSAACFIGLFFGAFYLSQPDQSIEPVLVEEKSNELIEFEKVELHFITIGKEIEKKLTLFDYPNEELKSQFKNDLSQLDSTYISLRKNLENSTNERIIGALIQNLNARIQILTRQQEILQHIKTLKPKENETLS